MDWAKHMQDETGNIKVLEFGAAYIKVLTVHKNVLRQRN